MDERARLTSFLTDLKSTTRVSKEGNRAAYARQQVTKGPIGRLNQEETIDYSPGVQEKRPRDETDVRAQSDFHQMRSQIGQKKQDLELARLMQTGNRDQEQRPGTENENRGFNAKIGYIEMWKGRHRVRDERLYI